MTRPCLLLLWLLIVSIHHAICIVNVAAALVAPFYEPWYVAGPVVVSVLWVTCSPTECRITAAEDSVRERLGWRPVRRFVAWYYVRPVKSLLRFCQGAG